MLYAARPSPMKLLFTFEFYRELVVDADHSGFHIAGEVRDRQYN
jgi:hypothetical protein